MYAIMTNGVLDYKVVTLTGEWYANAFPSVDECRRIARLMPLTTRVQFVRL